MAPLAITLATLCLMALAVGFYLLGIVPNYFNKFGSDGSGVRVPRSWASWLGFYEIHGSRVRYGLEKENKKSWTEVATEARTYKLKHMCHSPANDSVGWRDPGFVFDGLIKGLEIGRRYFYKNHVGLHRPSTPHRYPKNILTKLSFLHFSQVYCLDILGCIIPSPQFSVNGLGFEDESFLVFSQTKYVLDKCIDNLYEKR